MQSGSQKNLMEGKPAVERFCGHTAFYFPSDIGDLLEPDEWKTLFDTSFPEELRREDYPEVRRLAIREKEGRTDVRSLARYAPGEEGLLVYYEIVASSVLDPHRRGIPLEQHPHYTVPEKVVEKVRLTALVNKYLDQMNVKAGYDPTDREGPDAAYIVLDLPKEMLKEYLRIKDQERETPDTLEFWREIGLGEKLRVSSRHRCVENLLDVLEYLTIGKVWGQIYNWKGKMVSLTITEIPEPDED